LYWLLQFAGVSMGDSPQSPAMHHPLRTIALVLVCVWPLNSVSADDPRFVSVSRAGVGDEKGQLLVGDEFSVMFEPAATDLSRVRIGLRDPATTTDPTPANVHELPRLGKIEGGVRVLLPKGQAIGLRKLVYSSTPAAETAQWTDGAFVTVWNLPNAVVSDISPEVIRPNTAVKVSGSGLTAPASAITLTVGGIPAKTTHVDPEGRWFAATVEQKAEGGDFFSKAIRPVKGVQVSVWDVPASFPDKIKPRIERPVKWIWTLCLFTGAGLAVGAIYYLIARIYRTWPKAQSWVSAALIESKNNTYSLGRAQFIWWLTIITWAYLFLFLGRGWIEGVWNLPPLSGFAYTFLISLGTLVAGEVASAVRGVKGAGVISPSPSDLIMHGGVLALERVQQVMWTVVVGLMFLFISVKNYSSSTSLPTIPTELLTLMGFSSLGYLVGKTARKPGPVISSVTLTQSPPSPPSLEIVGENISATGARVQIDGKKLNLELR
jgi:hypothetical protein